MLVLYCVVSHSLSDWHQACSESHMGLEVDLLAIAWSIFSPPKCTHVSIVFWQLSDRPCVLAADGRNAPGAHAKFSVGRCALRSFISLDHFILREFALVA